MPTRLPSSITRSIAASSGLVPRSWATSASVFPVRGFRSGFLKPTSSTFSADGLDDVRLARTRGPEEQKRAERAIRTREPRPEDLEGLRDRIDRWGLTDHESPEPFLEALDLLAQSVGHELVADRRDGPRARHDTAASPRVGGSLRSQLSGFHPGWVSADQRFRLSESARSAFAGRGAVP